MSWIIKKYRCDRTMRRRVYSRYYLGIDIFIFGYREVKGTIIMKKKKFEKGKKTEFTIYPNPVIFLTLYLQIRGRNRRIIRRLLQLVHYIQDSKARGSIDFLFFQRCRITTTIG